MIRYLAAFAILIPAAGAAQARDVSLADMQRELEAMCRAEYVQYEHGAACELGGRLVLGAPPAANMQDYLMLLDQCRAVYRDSSGDFVAPVSAAHQRAACNAGVVWMQLRLRELSAP